MCAGAGLGQGAGARRCMLRLHRNEPMPLRLSYGAACRSGLLAFAGLLLLLPAAARAQTAGFEVTETTVAETQRALLAGRTTCREIVAAYLARIAAYDQATRLNSIVLPNPQAMADAAGCDREVATGHLRLLTGVAVIVKDNYDTRGLQTTGGSLAMRGFRPTADATTVRKLRDAGALVLAKSNMAEWAFSPYVTMSSVAGTDAESVRPDAGSCGVEWRDGGGGGGEPGRGGAWLGYGELDSRTFGAQRPGGDSADDRAGEPGGDHSTVCKQ